MDVDPRVRQLACDRVYGLLRDLNYPRTLTSFGIEAMIARTAQAMQQAIEDEMTDLRRELGQGDDTKAL
jgi:hypothetical protein